MTGGEPDALAIRERYRAERAKRLAADRTDISKLTGPLARYLEDPHTPFSERAAVRDDVDAMIVGGGLMAAARLNEAGLTRVRIVDMLRTRGYERLLGARPRLRQGCPTTSHKQQDQVTRGVLSSTPLLSFQRWMQSERASEFEDILDRCPAQVASDDPNGLVMASLPLPYLSGASQYLDSYGPQEKYNVLDLIGRVGIPVLAITGTEETRTFPSVGLPELFDDRAARAPLFRHLSIPEGDHVYTDQRAWVLGRVLEWLGRERP